MSDAPALDVLLPVRASRTLAPRDDEAELLDLFDDAPERHVRADMVASVDGGATGADEVSGSINGPADARVFRVLRALTDVVLIGAGTARQEQYTALEVPAPFRAQRERRGLPEHIELAVVSASGALPAALLDGERAPYVLTTPDNPRLDALRGRVGDDHVVAHGGEGGVDVRAALDTLAERGLRRVLAEGGPTLLAQLVADDLVDELCLTWSPLLVAGPAPRVLAAETWLRPARRLAPVHLLHGDGTLLGRWRVERPAASRLDA